MAAREDFSTKLRDWRCAAAQLGQTGLSAPALRLVCEVGIHALLGAVLSGAVIFGGCAPFGIAMVAASGTGLCGAGALVGTGFGYLALLEFSDALRYLSAAILTFAVAFAFYDVKQLRRPWAMALVAAGMNGCTGFVYLSQRGWAAGDVLCFLIEIAATAGACVCFRQALLPMRQSREAREITDASRFSLLVLTACALMAMSDLYLVQDISLGRALCVLALLGSAWKGGALTGSTVGLSLGAAMDFAHGGHPLYALAWGLAALAAGSVQRQKRLTCALAFVLTNAAATLWTWEAGMRISILYEVFLGSMAFLTLPEGFWRPLAPFLVPRQERISGICGQAYVRQHLQQTAAAFRSLYESMRGAFLAPANDNDVAAVFDRAACQVCLKCSLRTACWERDYVTTFNALNDATAPMLSRGRGEAGDFPAHFTGRCVHFPQFLEAVNRELAALLARRQYASRLRESRLAVCRQYGQLSTLLERAAAQLSCQPLPDPPAQRKLQQVLLSLGLEPDIEAFRDEFGRVHAHIRGEGWRGAARAEHIPAYEKALGVPLRAEAAEDELILVELEPLMAVAGAAAKKKEGETVSGDAGTYFKREDGTLYVLLCDGMGSGPLANRESNLAVRLLEQFLQAGVDTEHALITLNAALALRGEEDGGFTTIDLLQVDLFTGEGCIYKLGAAPTYIRRGGSVRKVSGSTLPAGLSAKDDSRPDCVRLRLEPGDCVLMVSDGVCGTGEDDWLRRRLADFQGESPKELCRTLITEAPDGATDDRTALMVKIAKRA